MTYAGAWDCLLVALRRGVDSRINVSSRTQPPMHYKDSVTAQCRKRHKDASTVDFEVELYWLAADLAVFDIACGASSGVKLSIEVLTAIRALDRMELQTAQGATVIRR